jgi:hypothetical protein
MSMPKPSPSLHETLKSVYTPTAESEAKKVNSTTISGDELKRAAKQLGSKGGKIGGKARAVALTAKRRSEIAKMGGTAAKRARGKEGN